MSRFDLGRVAYETLSARILGAEAGPFEKLPGHLQEAWIAAAEAAIKAARDSAGA